ncbi:transglycosylase domain-containing protein [Serratia proteamaculans]|uniref:Transglycosylase domain-containing protein n=1 Tax=Serratia proteamaculans TaxID=28151 RepID=A0A7U0N362_SERPR|nr:biosynthetic peptidoglycan transglycosylase [Serratia proteamaculans]MBO1504874.1 transglycosylase domain-containing protein [Serratia proteamaculans]MDW5511902.1 biosynthetic peptidoglycan transglycosylase [Serratia proteamaculans]QQX51644.1 transglycosylase domain-containing protein [Serratia proteamaculans]
MPKEKIFRASIFILTIPYFVLERIISYFNVISINSDFNLCCEKISNFSIKNIEIIDEKLIKTLVLAEDHRSQLHYGIDPIAIIRTLKLRLINKRTQGASTIEQQLIRTITRRYEKTPRRKIREQILAIMLCRKFTKKKIAECYLGLAYYGSGITGENGLLKIKNNEANNRREISISYLKYPKPKLDNENHTKKTIRRASHIINLNSKNERVSLFLKK